MHAPGDRRRIVVLCCILAVVAIAAPIVWATRHHTPDLTGATDQGHAIRLALNDRGKLIGVETRIDARCRGGHRWGTTWRPVRGWALFKQRGARIRVRELLVAEDGDGRTRWVLGRLVGRVRDGYAEGTVRLVARFWEGSRQMQACESKRRRWTAGIAATRRLAAMPPARALGPGGYYPSPPSLAGPVSPEREHFVKATDQTCAHTAPVHDAPLTLTPGSLLQNRVFVLEHAAQLRALERLGKPTDGVALHRRWLAYFRLRVLLEIRQQRLAEAGRFQEAAAVNERLPRLKMRQNDVGMRFGLTACTANGPDRSLVLR
jgi:hypothetical protein